MGEVRQKEKQGGRKALDMTDGVIWKQLLLFAVPLLIGNLFQQLYNTVDTIVVGNYIDSSALAAVSSSTPLINLIIGLFIGIATGSGVVIAQYYGAKREEALSHAVHTAFIIAFAAGTALIFIGIWISPALLRWMGTPDNVMENSVLYFRIYFCGSLFNLVYNMGAGILRGMGDSKRPLYYLAAASVTNVILDVFFVAGLGMGVEGVGYATVIAQGVSALLVLLAFLKTDQVYRLSWKKLRIHRAQLGRLLVMGIPNGLQTSIISLSNVIIQSNINVFGKNAMAGCGSYMKLDGFILMPIMSFGLAAMTFVGQNVGARKFERVKKGVWIACGLSVLYSIVIAVPLYLGSGQILKIFSRDPEVLKYAVMMMGSLLPYYWILSLLQMLTNAFRGAGKSVTAMVIMVGGMCGSRLIWVNVMTPVTGKLETVLQGYLVSWVCALACALLYARFSKWIQKKRTEAEAEVS